MNSNNIYTYFRMGLIGCALLGGYSLLNAAGGFPLPGGSSKDIPLWSIFQKGVENQPENVASAASFCTLFLEYEAASLNRSESEKKAAIKLFTSLAQHGFTEQPKKALLLLEVPQDEETKKDLAYLFSVVLKTADPTTDAAVFDSAQRYAMECRRELNELLEKGVVREHAFLLKAWEVVESALLAGGYWVKYGMFEEVFFLLLGAKQADELSFFEECITEVGKAYRKGRRILDEGDEVWLRGIFLQSLADAPTETEQARIFKDPRLAEFYKFLL